MDQIVYDESGKFLSGIFYEFKVPFDESSVDNDRRAGLLDGDWTVYGRNRNGDEPAKRQEAWMWVELLYDSSKTKKQYRCPLDKAHVTREDYGPFQADLFGGRLSDFLPLSGADGHVVVREDFAERLKASSLKGIGFEPIKIIIHKGIPYDRQGAKPNLKLFVARFLGADCQRPRTIRGVPNACPFCQHGPMICPTCGQSSRDCPKCGKQWSVARKLHEGPADKRLTGDARLIRRFMHHPILEGSRWDGSDFIYGRSERHFITKRALDWLHSVHAAPFCVKPVPVNVEGLSDKQIAKVKAAKELRTTRGADCGTSRD